MKIWKKIALVLSFCFAFSCVATACNDGNDSSSSSSSNSVAETPSPDPEEEEKPEDSMSEEEFMDMALDIFGTMLGQARSVKIDIDLSATVQTTTTQGASSSGIWTKYTLTGEAFVTETEMGVDGKFNFQVPVTSEVGAVEEREFYLLDGYVYEYHGAENLYERYQDTLYEIIDEWVQTTSEGQFTLATLLAGLGGSSGDNLPSLSPDLSANQLQSIFGKDATIEVKMEDSSAKVAIDSSASVGAIFDFIHSIDETTTYGEVIDYPLSLLFPDSGLTSEDIVDELYTHDDDTVTEFIAWLNTKSVAYTGAGLQDLYDLILKNDLTYGLLVNALGEERANELQAFEISAFEAQYGAFTLDEMVQNNNAEILSVLAGFGVTSEDFSQLAGLLDWNTLMFVIGESLEMPLLENIKEGSSLDKALRYAQNMDVTKAETNVTIALPDLILDTITVDGSLGFGYFKDNTEYTVEANAVIVLSEILSIKKEISLPEGAVVVVECDGCQEKKADTSSREDEEGYYCDDCYAQLQEPTEPTEPTEPSEPSEPTEPTEPNVPGEWV